MILKEYECVAHGPFEAERPVCPHGCTLAVKRVFRTPPAVRGERTGQLDAIMRREIEMRGMTDSKPERKVVPHEPRYAWSGFAGDAAGVSRKAAPPGPTAHYDANLVRVPR